LAQLALVFVLAVATRPIECIFICWRPRPWKAFVITSAMVLASALWLAALSGPFRGELYLGCCATGGTTANGSGPSVDYFGYDLEGNFRHWRDQVFGSGGSTHNESDPTRGDVVAPLPCDANISINGSSNTSNGSHSSNRSISSSSSSSRSRSIRNSSNAGRRTVSSTGRRAVPSSTTSTTSSTKRPRPCECCIKDKTFHVPAGALQCSKPSEEAIPCFVEHEQCAYPSRDGPCFVERKPYNKWFASPSEEECWCLQGSSCIDRIDSCLFPRRGLDGTGRVLFLVGDSHATEYVMALRKVIDGSMSLVFMIRTGSDCFRSSGGQEVYCDRIKRSIWQSLRPGDIVAMSYGAWRFTPIPEAAGRRGSLSSVEKYVSTLQGWHQLVASRNASLLVLGDQTPLRRPGIACAPAKISPGLRLSATLAQSRLCGRSAHWSELYGKHLRGELRKLEAIWPKSAHFFDPRRLFCGKGTCGALVPGTRTLAIGDKEHLTIEASFYMWPFLCSFFEDRGLLR